MPRAGGHGLAALGTPARSAQMWPATGGRPARPPTSPLLSLVRSGLEQGLGRANTAAAALSTSRQDTTQAGPFAHPAAARWWRLWARTQFAQVDSPPPSGPPAKPKWDRAESRYPRQHQTTRGRSAFHGRVRVCGRAGCAGPQSWSSSRANSLAGGGESEPERTCRIGSTTCSESHRSEMNGTPPVSSRADQPARSGHRPARTARMPLFGPKSSDPGPGSPAAPRRHSRAFGLARQYQVLKNAPVELAEDGNGAATPGRCGCRLTRCPGLGAPRPPCCRNPVLQQGPWRRARCWRRSFQGSA